MKETFRLSIFFLICMILLFSLGACRSNPATQPAASLNGNITVSGAFALYPLMQRWAEEYQKVNPGVKFDVSAGGAGKGMTDTLAGASDIGMISRAISKFRSAYSRAFW